MSFVIGLRLGAGRIVIASDTRITTYDWTDSDRTTPRPPLTSQDGISKIFAGPWGLITGTGYVPLLDRVCCRFCTDPPDGEARALAVIAEEQRRIDEDASIPPAERPHTTPVTGWIFTGRVARADGSPQLQMAHYHPSEGHRLDAVTSGCAVLMPKDLVDPWPTELLPLLDAIPIERAHLADHEATLSRVIPFLRTFIARCATFSPSIGPVVQVGVHLLEGLVMVSRPLAPGGSFHWLRTPEAVRTVAADPHLEAALRTQQPGETR